MLCRLSHKFYWTKIEKIIITFNYWIKNTEGKQTIETSTVNISAKDIKQGRFNSKDWRLNRKKGDEVLEMISCANEKGFYGDTRPSSNYKDLQIEAELSSKRLGKCIVKLSCVFDETPSPVNIYIYINNEELMGVDFRGQYRIYDNTFRLDSIQLGYEQYTGYGLAHIMFLLFGISIPFWEDMTGLKLNKITGTINERTSDNPNKSIPFYKSLSGTILPLGEKLILREEPYLKKSILYYQIEE